MKKILGFLKQRWLISLLGVLALAAIVWFIGPYIAIAGFVPLGSPVVRLVVILLMVAAWALDLLRRRWQARRADQQIMDGMAEADAGGAAAESAQEIAQLRERFDEALAVLRKKGRRGGAASLYELPWYIIIGPPGSGKTTALVNSGLDFPLADRFGKEALRGVGGTRNCDWWFTNEAVLLDTAGRYTTQDSHAAVDSAAWEGFLALLKRHRRRRPINGAIIAVSMTDLMLQGEQERAAHVRAIKQRIQELHTQLGIQFPVYMMFTKCDLVAGFMEFFDDLGREERAQVWGATLALPEGDAVPVGQFEGEYPLLLQRLNERLLTRMSQERDPRKRGMIFGFPQQMASLEQTLRGFLDDVFRPSRFEEPILLRGVYFTSGTQEGTPIDRLMGALSRSFGLDQQAVSAAAGHGRSYFITDLLKRVIFPEQGLVGVNRKLERQRAWLQHGAYATAIGATVAAVLAWTASFTANKAYLAEVSEDIAEYERLAAEPVPPDADFADLLPRLNALRETTRYSREQAEAAPLYMRLGMFQGAAVGAAAGDAYRRELNAVLLPKIVHRVEQQLARGPDDPDFQYEALKLYLMLGEPERLDPQLLSLWMSLDWQQTYPTQPDVQGDLQAHLAELLASEPRPALIDERLVSDVRRRLTQVPLAELVYGRLKRDYAATDPKPFRLEDAIGRDGDRVFVLESGRGLDAGFSQLFTYRGFYEIYQKESRRLVSQIREEDWVLGVGGTDLSQVELDHLDRNMRELYLEDYIRAWDALLRDVRIVPFQSIRQATEVVEVLSGPRSPMRALLEAVERNTALNRLPAGAKQLAEKAGEAAAAKSRLARLLGSAGEEAGAAAPELPGEPVERHFERLNELVRAPEGGSAPIDRIIGDLSDLYGFLGTLSGDFGGGGNVLGAVKGDGAAVLRRLRVEAARHPEPVKGWLQQLAGNTTTVTIGGARSQIDADWRANAAPVCERALAGRYPFDPGSAQDVPLSDFGRIFGYGGLLEQFFDTHLKSFADTSQRTWRWRPGTQLGIPDSVLRQFQRAERIRQAFFQDGGQQPSVRFTLKPMSLDKAATQVLLDIDGQRITYRHGPVRASNAQWPGPEATHQVRVVFEDYDRANHTLAREGPWAWFRVLDGSAREQLASDRTAVTFEVDGMEARYELRAASVVNPFLMMDELSRFRCPRSL